MSVLDDHALAADLAERAGHLLLTLRAAGRDPDTVRNAGDRQSHEFLMAELTRERPGDAVLSEEGIDDKARLSADRVWIVDPLDGTREFGEPGRKDWAVHVALWSRSAEDADAGELEADAVELDAGDPQGLDAGDPQGNAGDLIAGAVALPAQNLVLATHAAGLTGTVGDSCRTESPSETASDKAAERLGRWGDSGGPGAQRPLRLVVSRSRATNLVREVAARLQAELIPWGSAGAKVATVVTGETDAYLHSGGFYEWDTAAPVAVARQRGLHVSRIDGSPVLYNQEDPLLPDILVCRPAIAARLLDAITEAQHAI